MTARWLLRALAVLWWIAEWALALPPIIRQGFGPWHRAAFSRWGHDTAFQLVTLDYLLAYGVALALSVRDARRNEPRRWPLWTLSFLLATAPALLFYWAGALNRNGQQVK